jgi:hypothetical protein
MQPARKQCRRGLLEQFSVDVSQHHARTAIGEHLGERKAETAGGPGHQHAPVTHVEQPAEHLGGAILR